MRKFLCILAALVSLFSFVSDVILVTHIVFDPDFVAAYPYEYLAVLVWINFDVWKELVKLLITLEITCLFKRQHDLAHIYDSPGILLLAALAPDHFNLISQLPAPSRVNWATGLIFSDIPSLVLSFWYGQVTGTDWNIQTKLAVSAGLLSLLKQIVVLRHINHIAYVTATTSHVSWLHIDTMHDFLRTPRFRYLRVFVSGDQPPVAKEITIFTGETASIEVPPGIHTVKVSLGMLYPFPHAPHIIEGSGSKFRTIEFQPGFIQKIKVGFHIDYIESRKRWEGGCILQVKSVRNGPLVKHVFERRNWMMLCFLAFATLFILLWAGIDEAGFYTASIIWLCTFWIVPVTFLSIAVRRFYVRFMA